MKVHLRYIPTIIMFLLLFAGWCGAQQPLPEFSTSYQIPSMTEPPPERPGVEYFNAVLLIAALGVAAYIALRMRSRRFMLGMVVICLIYFGFVRQGCICAIGATQNFTLSMADPTYALPLVVAVFLFAPLIIALFFGRAFCSSVCPLGGIQEVVLLKPVKVARWLEQSLGMLRHAYLGLAILSAAMGGSFLICRYDPFVGFFRLSAPLAMLLVGGGMLLLGMFVGRPYCRFLCPYAVLLKWCSSVSKWHVSITPDYCIQCKLCEDSCPYGAIRKPYADTLPRAAGKRRLLLMLALVPVITAAGAGSGRLSASVLAGTDAVIRTARVVWRFERSGGEFAPDEVEAFFATGEPLEKLYAEADAARRRWHLGGWIFGGWMGLMIGGKLVALSVRRTRTDYEADRGDCLSCARCFDSCPREHLRHNPEAVMPVTGDSS